MHITHLDCRHHFVLVYEVHTRQPSHTLFMVPFQVALYVSLCQPAGGRCKFLALLLFESRAFLIGDRCKRDKCCTILTKAVLKVSPHFVIQRNPRQASGFSCPVQHRKVFLGMVLVFVLEHPLRHCVVDEGPHARPMGELLGECSRDPSRRSGSWGRGRLGTRRSGGNCRRRGGSSRRLWSNPSQR